MKLKKRNKKSRMRGERTCGYGFRQKHKGPGNAGGHGMAGTTGCKRQKALMIARKAGVESYFGKKGFTSRSTERKKRIGINLDDIQKKYSGKEIDLTGRKILGRGEGFKAVIKADSASKSAVEKMKEKGGEIIIKGKKLKKEKQEEGK